MFGVGRDLCGSSGPTPQLKQGQHGGLHEELVHSHIGANAPLAVRGLEKALYS